MEPACLHSHVWNRDETAIRKLSTIPDYPDFPEVPALSLDLTKIPALLAIITSVDCSTESVSGVGAFAAAAAVSVQPSQDPAYAQDLTAPSPVGHYYPSTPDPFLTSAQIPRLALTGTWSGLSFSEVHTNRLSHTSLPHHHHHHPHQPYPRPYMTDCIASTDIHTSLDRKLYYSSTVQAERDSEFVAASFSAPAAGGGRTYWSCLTSSNKRGRFECVASIEHPASDARHLSEFDFISSLPADIDGAPPPSYQEAVDMSFWGDLGKKWGEVTKTAKEGVQKLSKEFEVPPEQSQPAVQPARRQQQNQQRRPIDQPQSSQNIVSNARKVFETPQEPTTQLPSHIGPGAINDPYAPRPTPSDPYPRQQQPYGGYSNSPTPYRDPLPIPVPSSPSKQYNYIEGPGYSSGSYTGAPPPPYSPLPSTKPASIRRDQDDALIDFLNKERNPLTQMGIKTDPKSDHMAEPMDAAKKKKGAAKQTGSSKKKDTNDEPETPIEPPTGDDKSGGDGAGSGNGGDDKKNNGDDKDKKDGDKKGEDKKKEEEEKEELKIEEEEKKEDEPDTVPPTPSESVPPTPSVEKEEPFSEPKKKKKKKKGKDIETVPPTPAEEKTEIPFPDSSTMPAADAPPESEEASVTTEREMPALEVNTDVADQNPVEENDTGPPELTITESDPADLFSLTTAQLVEEATGEFQALMAENQTLKTQMHDAASEVGRSLSRLENRVWELGDEKSELQDKINKLEAEVAESRVMQEMMNQLQIERGRLVQLTDEQESQVKEVSELMEKLKVENSKFNDVEASKLAAAEAEASKLREELDKATKDLEEVVAEKTKLSEQKENTKGSANDLKLKVRDLTIKLEKTEDALSKKEKELLEAKAAKAGNVRSRVMNLEQQLEQRLLDELAAREEREKLSVRVVELQKQVDESPNEHDYQELKDIIAAKDGEIEDLKSQLAEANTKILALETTVIENRTALRDMEKLKDDIDLKDAEIELQAGEIETLNKRIAELEATAGEVETLKASMAEQEELIQASKDMQEDAAKELDDLRLLYEDAEEKVKDLEELKIQLEEAEKNVADSKDLFEAEKAELDEKVAALEGEKATLEEKVSAFEEEKTSFDEKIAALEEEKTSSDEKIAALEEEKTSFDERISALEEEKTSSDEKISALEEEKAALDESLQISKDAESALNDKIGELTTTNEAHEASLAAIGEEKGGLESTLAALTTEKEELEASLQAARDAHATLETRLSAQSLGSSVFVNEINNLKEVLASVKADLAAATEELAASKSENEEVIDAKATEIVSLTENITQLTDDVEAKSSELGVVQARVEQLEAELAEKAKELEEIGDKSFNEQLEEEIARSAGLAAEIEVLKANESREAPESSAELEVLREQLNEANTKVEALEAEMTNLREAPADTDGKEKVECRDHENEIYDLRQRIEDERIRLDVNRDELSRTQEELAAYQQRVDDVEKQKIAAQTRAAETLEESITLRDRFEEVERRALEAEERIAVMLSGKGDYQRPRQTQTPPAETVDFEEKLRAAEAEIKSAGADDPGFLPIPDAAAAATTEASRRERRRRHRSGTETEDKPEEEERRRQRKEERKSQKSRDIPDAAVSREVAPTEDDLREKEREKRRLRRMEEREREGQRDSVDGKERHRRSRRASGSEPRSPDVISPTVDDEDDRRKRREKTRKSLLAAAAVVTAAQEFGGSGSRREAPVKDRERESSHREREHREHKHHSHRSRDKEKRSRGVADTPTLSQGVTSDDGPTTPVDEVNKDPNYLDVQRPELRSLRTQSQRHSRLMIGGYEYESPRIASVTTYIVTGDGSAGSGSGEEPAAYQDKDAASGKGWGKVRGLLKRTQTAV
ncbi:hypothetical protein ABW20_dc0107637 [Dactylellina cionopaga]|nr:hypothetical protein ABW20_dc0107637 [Dactylellina cionopaga]